MRGAFMNTRRVAIGVTAVLAIAGGLLLFIGAGTGTGSGNEQTVRLTVQVSGLLPVVAQAVEVGDPIYTDPAGASVGSVVEVSAGPQMDSVRDSEGNLHARENPTLWQVEVVVEADGRETADYVAFHNEVVQVGQSYSLISKEYYIRGVVVSLDVR
ncbi:MAG: DUF4330 family protein [Coriobacteriia bacterium]|nr:DUF4330 family protein [Coriobacteriia bacterium]